MSYLGASIPEALVWDSVHAVSNSTSILPLPASVMGPDSKSVAVPASKEDTASAYSVGSIEHASRALGRSISADMMPPREHQEPLPEVPSTPDASIGSSSNPFSPPPSESKGDGPAEGSHMHRSVSEPSGETKADKPRLPSETLRLMAV